MFDNIAFNTVIGLVFIYLLYSLLTTIAGELLSSRLGIRQRILRVSIERMLNDGFYLKKKEKNAEAVKTNKKEKNDAKAARWWSRLVLQEAVQFKYSFAGRFYEYPSIKYLSKLEAEEKGIFGQTKPAYISAENFAETIINMLSEKGAGKDKFEQISFCLRFNTLNIETETRKHLLDILTNSANDLAAFRAKLMQWFNETQDRANGWYKEKLRLILFLFGFMLAAAFNVDSIKIAHLLAKDKEARNQLVAMGVALAKDSARYGKFIVAGGDSVRSKDIIDTGFSHITKDINAANLVLGLGWNFSGFEQDDQYSIDTSKDLFRTIKPYTNLLNGFIELRNATNIHLDNTFIQFAAGNQEADSLYIDSVIIAQKIQIAPDSERETLVSRLAADTAGIKNNKNQLRIFRDEMRNDSASLEVNTLLSESLYKRINALTGKRFVNIDSIHQSADRKIVIINGKRRYTTGEKTWYIISHIFWYNLVGLILTAFALSLGAPFWFGVLNKLVSLRAAGIKPEEKKKNTEGISQDLAVSTATKNIPTGQEDDVDTALRIYGDQIRKEKGVTNVAQGYHKTQDKVEKCVQVNVEDNAVAINVKSKYGDLRVGENHFVYLNVLVTGKNFLLSGNPQNKQLGIANAKKINGWGSFGCLVNDRFNKENKYLLTCYHVLNGDASWDANPVNMRIIDSGETEISANYQCALNNHHDTAIAVINNEIVSRYKSIKENPPAIREISFSDVFNTPVFLNGYSTKGAKGMIVHDSWDDDFFYDLPGGGQIKNRIENLILLTKIGDFGDSGSVLLDSAGNAVGMIIASNSFHSYAIKMSTILNDFGLELLK